MSDNKKQRTSKFSKFSKTKKRLVSFLLFFWILSICFVIVAIISGGSASAKSIGAWFPFIYFSALFFVTYHLDVLKKWLKKAYRPLIWIFYSGMILCLVIFIIFFILILGYMGEEVPENPDIVIVLGCQVYGDRPSNMLKSRLDEAIVIMNKYPNTVCVVSGGQGPDETMPEAQVMEKYLLSQGMDIERIYKESESFSSFTNLNYSKTVIEENDLNRESIVIITNEYHIPRAVLIAKRIYLDSDIYAIKATSPFNLFGSGIVREFFAFVKSYIFDRV